MATVPQIELTLLPVKKRVKKKIDKPIISTQKDVPKVAEIAKVEVRKKQWRQVNHEELKKAIEESEQRKKDKAEGRQRKPYGQKLTDKQKNVLEIVSEKERAGTKYTKGQVLKEAGYSEQVINHPAKVFDSPTVQQYYQELIPQSMLRSVLHKKINKKILKTYEYPIDMDDEEIHELLDDLCTIKLIKEQKNDYKSVKIVYVHVANDDVNLKALDMAHKIYKNYEDKKDSGSGTNILIQIFDRAMQMRVETNGQS